MSRILLRRAPRLLPSTTQRTLFTFSTPTRFPFATGPSPPRLAPEEQEEFEKLQKASTGAFSTPNPSLAPTSRPARPQINQSPHSESSSETSAGVTQKHAKDLKNSIAERGSKSESGLDARVRATGKGEELHPDVRRGAKPEFEGEVNPVTGEVGGPKNEPLRWGSGEGRGDWSYNGRVTDF